MNIPPGGLEHNIEMLCTVNWRLTYEGSVCVPRLDSQFQLKREEIILVNFEKTFEKLKYKCVNFNTMHYMYTDISGDCYRLSKFKMGKHSSMSFTKNARV